MPHACYTARERANLALYFSDDGFINDNPVSDISLTEYSNPDFTFAKRRSVQKWIRQVNKAHDQPTWRKKRARKSVSLNWLA